MYSYIGDQNSESNDTSISVIKYCSSSFHESEIADLNELKTYINDVDKHVIWINIKGKRNERIIKELRQALGIHYIIATYLNNPSQSPRFEIYDNYQLLVMSHFDLYEDDKVKITPISLLIGNNIVITIQNGGADLFSKTTSQLRSGDLRSEGFDYLIYTFINAVMESYHPVIDLLRMKLEKLEDSVISRKKLDNEMGINIHKISRRFMFAHHSLLNQKGALNDFVVNSDLVGQTKNSHYLRHCYDHSVETIDVIETCINMTKNLMNVYLASVNNRINEIMRTISIFVGVFAPMTVISGFYGMNFDNIPGAHQWWGLPLALLEMVVSTGFVLFIFKRLGIFKK